MKVARMSHNNKALCKDALPNVLTILWEMLQIYKLYLGLPKKKNIAPSPKV